jgi:uncharacterized lipoprotein YddW (UPF0748 family)
MGKVRRITWQRGVRSPLLIFLGLAIALVANAPFFVAAQPVNSVNPSTSPSQPAPPLTELRGVWLTNVDSDVLFSRAKLEQAVQRLQRLNFNTIYPTIWNGGYTLYPSPTAERVYGKAVEPIPEFQGRDMLAEAVEIGHAKGLTVIPWFEYGLMADEGTDIVRQHPDWVTRRRDGSAVIVQGDKKQHRLVYLNPARPEVRKMLVNFATEVVTKYNVDGIQFDDHFGVPVEFGYDDYTVALYQQHHNGKRPPNNPKDPEWTRWRTRLITNLLIEIFAAVKTNKPNCLISLSPNSKDFAYTNYLQNWSQWVRLGFVNEVVVQVYRYQLKDFLREIDQPDLKEVRRKMPVGIGILTGLRVRNVDIKQIASQVKATRDRKFHGFSFFFYESLGDRDAAFQTMLPTPASRPNRRKIATSGTYPLGQGV